MRGGSFNNNHNNARVAARNNNNPNNQWNNNNGFRVVALHSFSSRQQCVLPTIRHDHVRRRGKNWLA